MEVNEYGFKVEESEDAGTVLLRLHGDLDIAATESLQARLDALKAAVTPTTLDLAGIAFMDSSGMACIAQAIREAQQTGWKLSVSHEVSAQVQRLLELVDGELMFWPSGR